MWCRTMTTNHRLHRDLRPVPLSEALVGGLVMTMSEKQWDAALAYAYEQGWTLLDLDAGERPVRAYRKRGAHLDNQGTTPDPSEEQ